MEKRIYYHDTDAAGVVYYANYLKYLEEARTELLEQKGLSIKTFNDRGLLYAVSQCTIQYKSSARYGETLICGAQIKKITAVKLIFDQTIHEKKTNRLVVESEVTLVCLDKNFKPAPLPEDLKSLLR